MVKPIRRLSLTLLGCLGFWAHAQAQTTSPFAPPEEKLGTYVINSGSGLDTGCTYRGGGPLVIRVNVPKVVADSQINADGTLKNPSELVRNKVISAQASIRFPVFDIDDKAAPGGNLAPEVDRVSFNGRFKKVLSGFNNTWTDDTIIVPIEELKFGQVNELRIDIDTANVANGEIWCMAVDWVALQFEVAAPYVLAHGITANASTWEGASAVGVIAELDKRGVLYNRFSLGVAQEGNGSVAANARELNTNIENWLKTLKADRVHVIAHSKGGLDTQHLQALAPSFKILSLSTLSTPHLGSVAADLSMVQQTDADDKRNSGADPNGHVAAYVGTWTFGNGPQLPGLRDLTTYRATAAIGSGLRGNIDTTFTYGANADLNGDNQLTAAEAAPLFPGVVAYAARRAWSVLRDFSAAPFTITTVPGRFWGTRTVLTYNAIAAPAPQPNDIVVTQASANPGYGTSLGNVAANHSTVKSGANVAVILDRTIPLR
jgi:triacylglycerol lipase